MKFDKTQLSTSWGVNQALAQHLHMCTLSPISVSYSVAILIVRQVLLGSLPINLLMF